MANLPPTNLHSQQHYVNEYREFNRGFKPGEKVRTHHDPLFLVETLARLFIALGRLLLNITRWLFRTVRRKR